MYRHTHTQCFTGEDLLTIHGVDHEIGITEEQFVHLCPSLLQQILSESCNEVHEDEPKEISPLGMETGQGSIIEKK